MRLPVLSILVVAGCTTVGPDYKKPETETKLPGQFNADDPAFKVGTENLEKWWELFGDKQLNDLIERAAKQNLDVRIALARVNEARARLGIVSSQRSPQVGVGGDIGAGSSLAGGDVNGRYQAGVDASWELDVWGKIKRQEEAATADFEATVEQQRDVAVSLYAEVASQYLEVRTSQERLSAAQRNLTLQKEILEITRNRFKTGISSRLDVAQAERILADSETLVPPLRIRLVRAINTLGVLLGRFPKELHAELRAPKAVPLPPEKVEIIVPANLVRQRPDIRAAERRLAAETARVGVAKADLYPQFSLGGSLGYGNPIGAFNAGATNFFLGPSMRWNVFDGGRVRNQIKVQDFRVEQSVLQYESTVLNALEEVESAMSDFLENRIRVQAFERAAKIAKEELQLALKLYKDGLVQFQNILDVERALFTLESRVSQARGTAATSMVRLYKAMGGGWDPEKTGKADPTKFEKPPDDKRALQDDKTYQGGEKGDGDKDE